MIPHILKLNAAGLPQKWISYERSVYYQVTGKVLWSMGHAPIRLRGGTNLKTGEQSILWIDSIVAVDGPVRDYNELRVPLNNNTLFRRDHNICAYCGNVFFEKELNRDHIIPRAQGGQDIWENVTTSCVHCNERKGARTPEQAGMQLVYVPYAPNYAEYLILRNKRILADQMEYLAQTLPEYSRALNYVKCI